MIKILFIFFAFLITSCNASESYIDNVKYEFEDMSFDAVQKELVFNHNLPENVSLLINEWFNQKVKIDGLDGRMTFTITDYNEKISSIVDGKRVDLSLYFVVLLEKPNNSQKKTIKGEISSYGSLSGDFSISEFETLIQNTQGDLILRLSRDLKSKI
jgi:hypothetical protein